MNQSGYRPLLAIGAIAAAALALVAAFSFDESAGGAITGSAQKAAVGDLGSLVPSSRLANWAPSVTVGVPGGIPSWPVCTTVVASPANPQTTTGTIAVGSNQLNVSSVTDFQVGQGLSVANASKIDPYQDVPAAMSAVINAINGNVMTLSRTADYSVTGSLVSHDDTASVSEAIKNCPDYHTVLLGPGIFKVRGVRISIGRNNVAIRGSGMAATTIQSVDGNSIVFSGVTDKWWDDNSYGAHVLSGAAKGSNTLTLDNAVGIDPGTVVQIRTKNDYTLPTLSVTGYSYLRKQNAMVTAKSGNTITINPPLLANVDASYTYVETNYDFPTWYLRGLGLEDLTVDGSNLAQVGISFSGLYGSWIKNVAVKNVKNYAINVADSLFCEIRHSYIMASSLLGTNHAGLLMGGTTGCLVEDNISFKNFPVIEINGSSVGNVFGYNYLSGNTADTNHAPQNSYNLYEGNIADGLMSDGYFGGEDHITVFRNWITGTVPDSSGNQVWNGWVLALKRLTRNANVVGNILGTDGIITADYSLGQPNLGNASYTGTAAPSKGTWWQDWSYAGGVHSFGIKGSITKVNPDRSAEITLTQGADRLHSYCYYSSDGNCLALGYQWSDVDLVNGGTVSFVGNVLVTTPLPSWVHKEWPPVGTAIGIWPRSEGFQELDQDVENTMIKKGNYLSLQNGTGSISSGESLGGAILPPSLYLTSKPAWFGDLAWPPFDSARPNQSHDAIPAGYRFRHGIDAPGIKGDPLPTLSPTPIASSSPTPIPTPIQTTTPLPTPVATDGSYVYTVSLKGDGSGLVTNDKIYCGAQCSALAGQGTQVTVYAYPSADSMLAGWSGGCTGTGLSCSFTANSNSNVYADFELKGASPTPAPTMAPTATPSPVSTPLLTPTPLPTPAPTPAPQLSTVSTLVASGYTVSSAALNGSIDATGGASATSRGFQYGLTAAYGSQVSETGSYGTGGFSLSVSGLSCNTVYHYRADALNMAGMAYGQDQTFTTSACQTVDTAAPSIPGGLTAVSGSTSIQLSWQASTDNVGVKGYYIYRNSAPKGKKLATVTSTGFTDAGLSASTAYVYSIVAFDAAGNVSQPATVNASTLAAIPFAVGTYVKTTETVKVRSSPDETSRSNIIGNAKTGSVGMVIEGPVTMTLGSTWWKVDFGPDLVGWVVKDFLASN